MDRRHPPRDRNGAARGTRSRGRAGRRVWRAVDRGAVRANASRRQSGGGPHFSRAGDGRTHGQHAGRAAFLPGFPVVHGVSRDGEVRHSRFRSPTGSSPFCSLVTSSESPSASGSGPSRARFASPPGRALGIVTLQIVVAAAMVEMHLPASLRSIHQAIGTALWISVAALAALASGLRYMTDIERIVYESPSRGEFATPEGVST